MVRIRSVHLDDDGAGSVSVAPCWFVGWDGEGTATVQPDDRSYAPGMIARGDQEAISGPVIFNGTPGSNAVAFFDFS